MLEIDRMWAKEGQRFILVRLPQTNRLMVFFAEQRDIFKECDVVAEGTEEEMHRFRELGSEPTPEGEIE